MRVARVSNNELQDMFSAAFQDVVSENNINEFEAICERTVDGKDVSMEVTIYGFAGTPNQSEFEDLESVKEVSVPAINENEDGFHFILDSVYTLNTNDYVAVYKKGSLTQEVDVKDVPKTSKVKKSNKFNK